MKHKPTLEDIQSIPGLTLSNTMAAAALGMDPARLAQYGRENKLPWRVIVSGNRVKHSKAGLMKALSGEEVRSK